MDASSIHEFLSTQSYWAKGIPRNVVKRSLDHSLCFGLFTEQHKQIGFARVVSDQATFAYLADVYVLEQFRGQGLGRWLLQVVASHPSLQGLRRWMLATRDAHGLYTQIGFKGIAEPNIFMERTDPEVYAALTGNDD